MNLGNITSSLFGAGDDTTVKFIKDRVIHTIRPEINASEFKSFHCEVVEEAQKKLDELTPDQLNGFFECLDTIFLGQAFNVSVFIVRKTYASSSLKPNQYSAKRIPHPEILDYFESVQNDGFYADLVKDEIGFNPLVMEYWPQIVTYCLRRLNAYLVSTDHELGQFSPENARVSFNVLKEVPTFVFYLTDVAGSYNLLFLERGCDDLI